MNFWNILFAQKHGGSSTTDFFEELFAENTKPSKIETLTGVPPLTFVSDGSNLVDWAISGNSGGVGERTKNLFELAEPQTTVYNVDFVPDKKTGKIVASGLCSSTASSQARFSFNGDERRIISESFLQNGMKFSCDGLVSGSVCGIAYYTSNDMYISEQDCEPGYSEQTIAIPETAVKFRAFVRKQQKAGAADVIFKPMLRPADTSSDFEPYGYKIPITCGGVTTNIFTQSQLMDGDVLTLADTGVNIPTTDGSNTLTVGTTVQPSSMTITYKGK